MVWGAKLDIVTSSSAEAPSCARSTCRANMAAAQRQPADHRDHVQPGRRQRPGIHRAEERRHDDARPGRRAARAAAVDFTFAGHATRAQPVRGRRPRRAEVRRALRPGHQPRRAVQRQPRRRRRGDRPATAGPLRRRHPAFRLQQHLVSGDRRRRLRAGHRNHHDCRPRWDDFAANWQAGTTYRRRHGPGHARWDADSAAAPQRTSSSTKCSPTPTIRRSTPSNSTTPPARRSTSAAGVSATAADNLPKFQIPAPRRARISAPTATRSSTRDTGLRRPRRLRHGSPINEFGGTGPDDFALNSYLGDQVWLAKRPTGRQRHASGRLRRRSAPRPIRKSAASITPNRSAAGRTTRPTCGSGDTTPSSRPTLGHANDAGGNGPRVGPLVISEVMYNVGAGPNADDLEFIEIYNPTAGTSI